MDGDMGPAKAVAVGLLAAALVANAWLLRRGHEPLTELFRTDQGRAFRRYFDDHCEQRLAVDLFSIAGRFVTPKESP